MTYFYNLISSTPPVAQIIISIAIMLLFGFLISKLTSLLKLPNVTGYILAGILIGPYCFNMIPADITSGMDFISDIALAFIAFSVGEFFKFDNLKRTGAKVIVIALFEALLASVICFVVTYFVIGLNLAFSIVLSALASATAPTAIIMTIRQTDSKGHFVDVMLQDVAIGDVISLFAYSIAISIAITSIGGNSLSFSVIFMPILKNLASIAVGIALGFLLKVLLTKKRSSDNRLVILIFVLLVFCAFCVVLDVSPLLGCMVIGTTYINASKDETLFLQVNYFSPPFLLLFFVRSGVNLNLSSLFSSSSLFALSIGVISLIYFFARNIGKIAGAYVGSVVTKQPSEVKKYLGISLLPQASVAIGLATLGARAIGGDAGSVLLTIVLASSVLNELLGPALVKLSLYLSKSYSNKIEDKVEVKEIKEDGTIKTEAELLIERIQAISLEEKENSMYNKQEEAFTKGGEEMLETYNYNVNRRDIQRRRKN